MTAIEEFESQPVLQPGEVGWWRVWGAQVRHVQAGDILLIKGDDGSVETCYITGTFESKAAPLRFGLVDDRGPFTLGALVRIGLFRAGTHNTLAS